MVQAYRHLVYSFRWGGCIFWKARRSRPPGPATDLPYKGGHIYIKINFLGVFLKPKITKKCVFFWDFGNWTENGCTRRSRAYYRAIGVSWTRFLILRRYWPELWCKRIDIWSTASGSAFENFHGPRCRPPGPATDLPYKGGVYILSKTWGLT